jgi:dehydrogenase/reductase SDR family member 7B
VQYFQNKVVWITGASSGIGEALTHELGARGARIIISSRRLSELERVKDSSPRPQDVHILPLDLEDGPSLPAKAAQAISTFGHLDIMVHNGGIGQRSFVTETSMAVHRRVMEIDYFSYVELTAQVLPHFQQRKSGHFVVLSSLMGKIGTPKRSAYAAAKHALHGFFDCLRAEIQKDHIRVTVLTPGYIQTNFARHAFNASGTATGVEGKDLANGLAADKAARQIARAIAAGKYEGFIGKAGKEMLALWMNRFAPNLLIRMAPKQVPE